MRNIMKTIKYLLLSILLFLSFSPVSAWSDIIIDNLDPGFQLIGPNTWDSRENPPWPAYGSDCRFTWTGSGADQALYTFEITEPGMYEVSGWWPTHDVCSTNTPYTIPFSDGQVTILANQKQNPGQWNFLASGYFNQGTHQIVISNNANGMIVVRNLP